MPLYDFIDTETGEEFELMLKIAEREEFLKDNPNTTEHDVAKALKVHPIAGEGSL